MAFGHAVLALALLTGLAHANGRYFFCEAMGLLQGDPCVAAAAIDADGDDSPSVRATHDDCCEVLTLPPMPAGEELSPPVVRSSPVVAAACAVPTQVLHPSSALSTHSLHESWRAPPISARQLRAQLMVFLT